MRVDQHIVVHDHGFVVLDVADAAHVGGEIVDFGASRAPQRSLALLPPPQIQQLELVGRRRAELRVFEIDAPDPISIGLERGDEVVANESTGTGDNGPSRRRAVIGAVRSSRCPLRFR